MDKENLVKVLKFDMTEEELKTLTHKLFLLEMGPVDEEGFYHLLLEVG